MIFFTIWNKKIWLQKNEWINLVPACVHSRHANHKKKQETKSRENSGRVYLFPDGRVWLWPPSASKLLFFFLRRIFSLFLILTRLEWTGSLVLPPQTTQHGSYYRKWLSSEREREYGMPDIFSFVWLQREKEIDEIIIPSHFSKKRTMEKRNVVSNLCGSLSRFNGGH